MIFFHQLFSNYRDVVKNLLDSGQIKKLSYRYQVKPRALRETPTCKCAAYIEDRRTDPPTFSYESGLPTIPLRYLRFTASDGLVLLRQDSSTTLSEIKKFHARKLQALQYPEGALLEHCQKLDMAMDGVQECAKGRRTLVVVTVRLGGGSGPIYPWKVLNPLIGNANAKQTADDILR